MTVTSSIHGQLSQSGQLHVVNKFIHDLEHMIYTDYQYIRMAFSPRTALLEPASEACEEVVNHPSFLALVHVTVFHRYTDFCASPHILFCLLLIGIAAQLS